MVHLYRFAEGGETGREDIMWKASAVGCNPPVKNGIIPYIGGKGGGRKYEIKLDSMKKRYIASTT